MTEEKVKAIINSIGYVTLLSFAGGFAAILILGIVRVVSGAFIAWFLT